MFLIFFITRRGTKCLTVCAPFLTQTVHEVVKYAECPAICLKFLMVFSILIDIIRQYLKTVHGYFTPLISIVIPAKGIYSVITRGAISLIFFVWIWSGALLIKCFNLNLGRDIFIMCSNIFFFYLFYVVFENIYNKILLYLQLFYFLVLV